MENAFDCTLCGKVAMSHYNYMEHVKSAKHLKKMAEHMSPYFKPSQPVVKVFLEISDDEDDYPRASTSACFKCTPQVRSQEVVKVVPPKEAVNVQQVKVLPPKEIF